MKTPFVFSEFRKSLGFTQEEFAKKCGTTIRTVQNWEKGGVITPQAMKLFQYIEAESISGKQAIAVDHSTAVSGSGNKINTELEALTEKFISLLQEKDNQISRLISIIEKSSK